MESGVGGGGGRGTLEERVLAGLDPSRSTLYVGNVAPGGFGGSESLLL